MYINGNRRRYFQRGTEYNRFYLIALFDHYFKH